MAIKPHGATAHAVMRYIERHRPTGNMLDSSIELHRLLASATLREHDSQRAIWVVPARELPELPSELLLVVSLDGIVGDRAATRRREAEPSAAQVAYFFGLASTACATIARVTCSFDITALP